MHILFLSISVALFIAVPATFVGVLANNYGIFLLFFGINLSLVLFGALIRKNLEES